MVKTIKGQQLTRRTWVAGGVAAAVSTLLTGCGGGGVGLEEPSDALMPMASGPGSAGFTSNHNYGQEVNGGSAIARQVLDLYRGNIPASTRCPVYIYAHSNGEGVTYRTQLPSDSRRLELINNGIAVISWESWQNLNDQNQDEVLDDADLMLRWVIEKGPALGLDPTRIVLGGSSRGTYASWRIGQTPANAQRIRGMFMKNALPASVPQTLCGTTDVPNTIDDKAPRDWVTASSPRIQFVHHPANINGACTPYNDRFHSEYNSRPVMDAYAEKGIASRASRILDAPNVGAMDNYLVAFVLSALSASPPPPPPTGIDFSDDFNSGFNAADYTRNGTWDVSGGALRQMSNTSYGYCAAGESAWANYTVTAALMSLNSQSSTDNAQVSRVVARFIDGNNFYEAFITKNGQLTLQTKKGGNVRTIQSVQVGSVNVANWNTLALKCNGNQLTVSLNGIAQPTVSDSDHTAGKAGVRSFACETRVDNLSIMGT